MSVIIPRGTQIPTKKSQIFTTSTDKQSTVSTKVLYPLIVCALTPPQLHNTTQYMHNTCSFASNIQLM